MIFAVAVPPTAARDSASATARSSSMISGATDGARRSRSMASPQPEGNRPRPAAAPEAAKLARSWRRVTMAGVLWGGAMRRRSPYGSAQVAGGKSAGHSLSNPCSGSSMAVIKAKCPPADSPNRTNFEVSKPYSLECWCTQRNAQRQSSTADGASATEASRYSTFTAFIPRAK